MKKRILRLSIAVILLTAILAISAPVVAQTYAFSLDEQTVDVYWESDGTATLRYIFVFTNAGYADPLDFVDVGLPTSSYNLAGAAAWINGEKINHIADSPYVTNGVELGLGGNAIQPGQTGTVEFFITGIGNVLYVDSDDDTYASAVFSPTWFDSDFVSGDSFLQVRFHLPPGVTTEEPRWHQAPSGFNEEPFSELDEDGRVTYIWENPTASPSRQYLFGASFPASYVPTGVIATPTFTQNYGIDWGDVFTTVCMCLFGSMFVVIPALSIRNAKKRKMQYLPPKLAIEGHGIKRGLTAVEAAVLLETPMDKIMTMILFSTIKKGAITVTNRKPLTVDVHIPSGAKLRAYEQTFLAAMEETSKAKQKKALQNMMVSLVKSVSKSMKGFSRRESQNYYKKIMEAAWKQVEDADTPEIKSEAYEKVMEWTMLDKEYDERTRRTFHTGPVFLPHWWHRYSPGPVASAGPSVPGKTAAPTSRPTPGGSRMPTLPGADFAGSIVTGVQDFAAGVVGSIPDFTSGVTNKTNPIPKSSSSSSPRGGFRGGGGSSCACACACAGCACACAGGGR